MVAETVPTGFNVARTQLQKLIPKAKEKFKNIFKKKDKTPDGGAPKVVKKGGLGTAVGGASVGAGLIGKGAIDALGNRQQIPEEESGMGVGGPNGIGGLGGLSSAGMMAGLGVGGIAGGGGVVQEAPEAISIDPSKSIFEQILSVLIKIKQDTGTLLQNAMATNEAQARAIDAAEASAAESKTESKRTEGTGIKEAAAAATSKLKKGISTLGGLFGTVFAADVINKLIRGDDKGFFAPDKKEPEVQGPPMPEGMEPEKLGFFAENFPELTKAVDNMFTGLKNAIFAGTPGHEEFTLGESLKQFGKGVAQFLDELNPLNLLALLPNIEKGDIPKLSDGFDYLFGAEGQESPFMKDAKEFGLRVKEAFTLKPEVIDEFQTLSDSIKESAISFRDKIKEKIDSVFETIGNTFQRIKDFFSLENLKSILPDFIAKRIGNEEEVALKPSEEEANEEETKKLRKDVIEKFAEEGQKSGDRSFEVKKLGVQTNFNKDYEDLDPSSKAFVDREIEFQKQKKMREEGLKVEPKQRSELEKDPFKNNLGTAMMANGSPTINSMMTQQVNNQNTGGSTTNNTSTSVQTNIQQGGDGGGNNSRPGTRNPDSMYSGRTSDYSAGLSAM